MKPNNLESVMMVVTWIKPQRALPYFYQKYFHFLTKSLTTAYLPERKMFHMIPASDESGLHGLRFECWVAVMSNLDGPARVARPAATLI